jgi:hypothetical protein
MISGNKEAGMTKYEQLLEPITLNPKVMVGTQLSKGLV